MLAAEERRQARHGRTVSLAKASGDSCVVRRRNGTGGPGPAVPRRRHCRNSSCSPTLCSGDMALQRMDNVLIVVDDLEASKAFFAELGMELEGETQVEGPWVDSVV